MTSLWAAALATGLSVVYALDTYEHMVWGTQPSDAANVLNNTLSRSAWALALGWLVFACHHGYGGFVDRLLSWEAFGPLGRLAFNVYLLHYPLLPLIFAQFTYPVVLSHWTVVSVE